MITGGPDDSNSPSLEPGVVTTSSLLESYDLEARKSARAEARRERDVGRVASPGHQDAPDPGSVVPCIECVPLFGQIDFEPGAEIHRRRIRRNTDIAEIARAVARWNIHAPAERDGEVCEIAAHAEALVVSVPCGPRGARVLVSEDEPLVDVIADGLDPRPTWFRAPEQRPGDLRQAVCVAVAA